MAPWDVKLAAQREANVSGVAQILAKSMTTRCWTWFAARPGFRKANDHWFSEYDVVWPAVKRATVPASALCSV